jgi:hypothetical protein
VGRLRPGRRPDLRPGPGRPGPEWVPALAFYFRQPGPRRVASTWNSTITGFDASPQVETYREMNWPVRATRSGRLRYKHARISNQYLVSASCPFPAAHNSGVWPWLSLASTSALPVLIIIR